MRGKAKTHSAAAAQRRASLARPLLIALTAALTLAALAPAIASAALTRPYQSSFGTFGGGDPRGLAVDQSSGDVYASTQAPLGNVSRFDSSGAPDNFTAGPGAGTNTLTGIANSAPEAIAIDNSGGPLDGDIYVPASVTGGAIVKVFAPSGESLGVLDGSGTPDGVFGNLCGVAVDPSNGDLYIAQNTNRNIQPRIWRYRPNSPSGPIEDSHYAVSGIVPVDKQPCGLALSSGQVYAASHSTGHPLIKYPLSAFAASPPSLEAEPILEGVSAVAADPKTGEVYADRESHVTVLDAANDFPTYEFGLNQYFKASGAIALKSAGSGPAEKVYVADVQNQNQVDIFGEETNAPDTSRGEVGAFGPDGSSSSSFSLFAPGRLGFDQAQRRLYALDEGTPGIYGFGAAAPPSFTPLAGFAPLTTAAHRESPGLAVDNSGTGSAGNLYLASQLTNLVYGFSSSAAALAGFPIDPAISPGAPFGSPKELCGAAVDPAGHLWVANSATKRILEYSAAGASLGGAIDTSAQGNPCGITFDSAGNLYAIVSNRVWRYSAASAYTAATLIDSAYNPKQVAVDRSTGELYVAHFEWVDVFDSAGNFEEEFASGFGQVTGIAVDEANGDVYVSAARQVHVFGPAILLPDVTVTPASGVTNTAANLTGTVGGQGSALGECRFQYVTEAAFHASGFSDLGSGGSVPCNPAAGSIPADGNLHAVSASLGGLTRNTAYRFRLLAANANGSKASVDVGFETVGPPLVETTGSPVHTTTTARLDSRVDPKGAPATYYFEYGSEGPCDSNPCTSTEPHPAGSRDEFELVSQQLEGLEAGATYHYRVVADNGNADGPAAGEDMTLTTFSAEEPLSHGHFPGPPGSDRAWELVSEPDTSGNPASGGQLSDAGDRAVFYVEGGTPLSEAGRLGTPLFSERTPSGWQTKSIFAHREDAKGELWKTAEGPGDFSSIVAENRGAAGTGEVTVWRLRPSGEPEKLYGGESSSRQIDSFLAVSEDGSRTLITLRGPQDPAHPLAAGVPGLYDIGSAPPRLVSLLPDGTAPACGISGNQPSVAVSRTAHWVSADGSLAFFSSAGNNCAGIQHLYVSDIPAEATSLISGQPLSGPDCSSYFVKSIPGAAYFYTQSRLVTKDSAPASCNESGDVYRYGLGDGSLECVTCTTPGLDAGVTLGTVNVVNIESQVAIAEDGSRVYFVSTRRLLPGAPRKGGGTYRLDTASGDLAYVGPVPIGNSETSELNPDGSVAIFRSADPRLNALEGQQNGGSPQYYRYDDKDRSLVCVSCPADGSAAKGAVGGVGDLAADGNDVAFSTPTPLASADQNTAGAGQAPAVGTDVYEWRGGRLLLVSDGLTNWPGGEVPRVNSLTPSGRDVFFSEAAALTPDALDGYRRAYDARIGGGFEFPPPPRPCPLEVCQGTPKGAPEEQAPGSAYLQGAGNDTPSEGRCPKGKVRRRGRCVGRHTKHTRKPAHHKRAKHDRRAGR